MGKTEVSWPRRAQFPPQGGEGRLCCTVFIAFVLAILSAVTMVYSTVIIYIPSMEVFESKLEGPYTCTTLKIDMNIAGEDECDEWSSCEEWCLGVSKDSCTHILASVRKPGVNMTLSGCRFEHHEEPCKTLKELRSENCKKWFVPKVDDKDTGLKNKNICINFHDNVISCIAGRCKQISEIYECSRNTHLDLLKEDNFCGCENCQGSKRRSIKGECPHNTKDCFAEAVSTWDSEKQAKCTDVPCSNCFEICQSRQQCFNMKSARDPTLIGKDEYDRPLLKHYTCKNGTCMEIYNLTCQRKCHKNNAYSTRDSNLMIRSEEVLATAKCDTINVEGKGDIEHQSDDAFLMVSCSAIDSLDAQEGTAQLRDCIDGVWLSAENFTQKDATLHEIMTEYQRVVKLSDSHESLIKSHEELVVADEVKMKINLQGCVNSLSSECSDFYQKYSKDGRNDTARAIYDCFFDPGKPDEAVINFNPEATRFVLLLFTVVPGVTFLVTCSYVCLCNRMMFVANDGRMRMRCGGKFVTGIGKVKGLTKKQLDTLHEKDK